MPLRTVFIGIVAFLIAWLVLSVAGRGSRRPPQVATAAHWLAPAGAAAAALLVMLLGGYMKSVGAGFACPEWPLCQGAIVPQLEGPVLVHFVHRLAAVLAGVFVVVSTVTVWRMQRHRPAILAVATVAFGLYLTEVLLGGLTALQTLPPAAAPVHLAISSALFASLVLLAALSYRSLPILRVAGGGQDVAALAPGIGALGLRRMGSASSDPRGFAADAMRQLSAKLGAYLALTKPRIIVLLLVTGYAGMWVAQRGAPPAGLTFWSMLGLALSCGGANAINMYVDRDIDRIMRRTQRRPIPSGRLTPTQVLRFGVGSGVTSFILLALTVNLLTAVLALAGLLFYVFIYTLWLKRSTPQNIVIGGAAGAVPPMVGWAAVAGEVSLAAVVMFLIVFLWTPPHFWALALFRNEDYRRANIPMLPVVRGEAETKRQIALYSIVLLATTLLPYLLGAAGGWYLGAAIAFGLLFVAGALWLWRAKPGEHRPAHVVFGYSLLYLAFIFAAWMADVA